MLLDGFLLVGLNGRTGEPFMEISLDGHAIPLDGLFVVAQSEAVPDWDMVDSHANVQNGPDTVQLLPGEPVLDPVADG